MRYIVVITNVMIIIRKFIIRWEDEGSEVVVVMVSKTHEHFTLKEKLTFLFVWCILSVISKEWEEKLNNHDFSPPPFQKHILTMLWDDHL